MPNQDINFSLDNYLPYLATVLGNRLSTIISSLYGEKFDISLPEWRVMVHLNEQEKISVRDIFQQVELDKVRITRAAQSLESKGYISKETDQKDRRLVSLALTPRGREIIAEIIPLAQQYEKNLCACLNEEEQANLQHLFTKLLAHLPQSPSKNNEVYVALKGEQKTKKQQAFSQKKAV